MLRTGRWNQVERLRGTLDPERLFQSIPGVGASLARRIHESLRVTALFSNTARAHQLGRTHDWVVVYFHADSQPEGQRTVVTETAGELKGKRVVRGLEVECHAHYRQGNGGARTPQSAHRSLTGRPCAGPAC